MGIETTNVSKEVLEKFKESDGNYHIPVSLAFKHLKKDSGIYAKLISWWTGSKYFHVEVIFGEEYWFSANMGDGVYIRKLRPERSDDWDYFKLKPVIIRGEDIDLFISLINKQNGKKYDTLGIFFSQVLRMHIHDRNTWFCSELAIKFMELFGKVWAFNQLAQDVSPYDLYKKMINSGDVLEKVYNSDPIKV